MKAVAVLEDSLALLDEEGWKQLGMGLPGGPKCSMGAVTVCLDGGFQTFYDCANLLTAAIFATGWDLPVYERTRIRHPAKIVIKWNDAMGRTIDQVKAVFAAAITLGREQA